jgi:dipeptidyl aminopeptidase/acylaminoacyl peptidase
MGLRQLPAVFLTSSIALIVGVTTPAHAVTNGPIGAVTAKDSRNIIFTVNPDGSSFTLRVAGSNLTWSPNGIELAYIAPNQRIAIHTETETIRTDVPAPGPDVFSPSRIDWSPDGTRIAYVNNAQVWVMNATAPYAPERVSTGCQALYPSWSADSQQIAYVACDNRVHVMNSDGGGDHVLANPLELQESWLDWSPDGSSIAFLSVHSARTGLWVMDADGNNQRFLAATDYFCCGDPSWSPDSTQIAFVGDGKVLDIVNADGTGLTEVPTPGVVSYPSWGPAT